LHYSYTIVAAKENKKNRIFRVHPINARREEVRLIYNLFNDLRNDENKFFSYFRMSSASFDVFYEKLKHKLQRENT
jgi:hypothetical protein